MTNSSTLFHAVCSCPVHACCLDRTEAVSAKAQERRIVGACVCSGERWHTVGVVGGGVVCVAVRGCGVEDWNEDDDEEYFEQNEQDIEANANAGAAVSLPLSFASGRCTDSKAEGGDEERYKDAEAAAAEREDRNDNSGNRYSAIVGLRLLWRRLVVSLRLLRMRRAVSCVSR